MARVHISGDDIARELAERGIDHVDTDGVAEVLSDLADRARVSDLEAALEDDRRREANSEAAAILARVRGQ